MDNAPQPTDEELARKCTPMQLRFARLVPISESITKAAISAGYSQKSAKDQAYQLMKLPSVMAATRLTRAKISLSSPNVTEQDVFNRLADRAMANPTDLLVPDEKQAGEWRTKRPDELTDRDKSLIKGYKTRAFDRTITHPDGIVETTQVMYFEYTLHNGMDALDSIAKTFGMYRERVEHTTTIQHNIDAMYTFVSDAMNRRLSTTVGMVEAKARTNAVIEHGNVIDGRISPRA